MAPEARDTDRLDTAPVDDLERIEAPFVERGRDLDKQRHDAEPADRQRLEVVAREHGGTAVEVVDAHRHPRP